MNWLSQLRTDSILSLPVRFDRGGIRNAQLTPEGYLLAEAVYCRDGILDYRSPSGRVRREFRPPEANKAALENFGFKPYTTEHPPVLLDATNAKQYAQGFTDSTTFYDPKAGFVRGVIAVFDSEAIASIQQGKTVEISAGYQCAVKEEPGTWRGERYDAIQEIIKPNHVAGTIKGRAGAEVRFLNLFDSYASNYGDVAYEDEGATNVQYFTFSTPKKRTDTKKTMATFTRGGLTFEDIPGDLAGFITQEFNKLDSAIAENQQYISTLETAARTDADTIGQLNTEVEEQSSEASRHMGRADELEVYLTNADSILSDMGYRRDSDGDYYRADKKGKKPAFLEEIEMSEEEAEEEADKDNDEPEDEADKEDMPWTPKQKKGVKKSTTHKKDSVSERLAAWKEVEKIAPGTMDSDRFDDGLDLDGINALRIDAMKEVITQHQPNYPLEGQDASAIQGAYTLLTLSATTTRTDHTDNFEVLLSAAARNGAASPLDKAREEMQNQLNDQWRTKLSMSTRQQ